MWAQESESSPVKAIDLGLTQRIENDSEALDTSTGTLVFMAPEILQGRLLPESDIWSAGVMLFFLLSGEMPFSPSHAATDHGDAVTDGASDVSVPSDDGAAAAWAEAAFLDAEHADAELIAVYKAILTKDVDELFRRPPWDDVSARAVELVRSMLQRNPKARPTAEQLLRDDPWLSELSSTSERERAKRGIKTAGDLSTSIVSRLQAFASTPAFMRIALSRIVSDLTDVWALESDCDGSECREATEYEGGKLLNSAAAAAHLFATLDTDGDGFVCAKDIELGLRNSGFRVLSHEGDVLVPSYFLTQSDFLAACLLTGLYDASPRAIESCFEHFATGDGLITRYVAFGFCHHALCPALTARGLVRIPAC